MAYYPDDERLAKVVDYLRLCDEEGRDVYQREIHRALGLNKNSVWKAVQALVDDGRAEKIPTGDGPSGHKRLKIRLTEWELMTEDQKERLITALERIAENQERMMAVPVMPVSTYNIGTAVINNNPLPPDPSIPQKGTEIPERRMPPMEIKGE